MSCVLGLLILLAGGIGGCAGKQAQLLPEITAEREGPPTSLRDAAARLEAAGPDGVDADDRGWIRAALDGGEAEEGLESERARSRLLRALARLQGRAGDAYAGTRTLAAALASELKIGCLEDPEAPPSRGAIPLFKGLEFGLPLLSSPDGLLEPLEAVGRDESGCAARAADESASWLYWAAGRADLSLPPTRRLARTHLPGDVAAICAWAAAAEASGRDPEALGACLAAAPAGPDDVRAVAALLSWTHRARRGALGPVAQGWPAVLAVVPALSESGWSLGLLASSWRATGRPCDALAARLLHLGLRAAEAPDETPALLDGPGGWARWSERAACADLTAPAPPRPPRAEPGASRLPSGQSGKP